MVCKHCRGKEGERGGQREGEEGEEEGEGEKEEEGEKERVEEGEEERGIKKCYFYLHFTCKFNLV